MSTAWKLSMQGITKKRPGPCTAQYRTVQYSTVQYSTVQYSTVQYSTVQYSTDNRQTTSPPPTHRGAATLQSAQPEDHRSLVLLDHLQIFSHGYIFINTLVIQLGQASLNSHWPDPAVVSVRICKR